MDRHTLAIMIPILALSIPVLAIVFGGLVKLQRERNRSSLGADLTGDVMHQLDDMREEVQALRGELTEVQERLDFTERLLASGQDRRQPT